MRKYAVLMSLVAFHASAMDKTTMQDKITEESTETDCKLGTLETFDWIDDSDIELGHLENNPQKIHLSFSEAQSEDDIMAQSIVEITKAPCSPGLIKRALCRSQQSGYTTTRVKSGNGMAILAKVYDAVRNITNSSAPHSSDSSSSSSNNSPSSQESLSSNTIPSPIHIAVQESSTFTPNSEKRASRKSVYHDREMLHQFVTAAIEKDRIEQTMRAKKQQAEIDEKNKVLELQKKELESRMVEIKQVQKTKRCAQITGVVATLISGGLGSIITYFSSITR